MLVMLVVDTCNEQLEAIDTHWMLASGRPDALFGLSSAWDSGSRRGFFMMAWSISRTYVL